MLQLLRLLRLCLEHLRDDFHMMVLTELHLLLLLHLLLKVLLQLRKLLQNVSQSVLAALWMLQLLCNRHRWQVMHMLLIRVR